MKGERAWEVIDKVGNKSTVYADHVVYYALGTGVYFYRAPKRLDQPNQEKDCLVMFREPASVKLLP